MDAWQLVTKNMQEAEVVEKLKQCSEYEGRELLGYYGMRMAYIKDYKFDVLLRMFRCILRDAQEKNMTLETLFKCSFEYRICMNGEHEWFLFVIFKPKEALTEPVGHDQWEDYEK